MPIKLIVTDLDGTLLNAHGEVHPADREAIGQLQLQGVTVSIATGRMYSGTREIARSLSIDAPVACVDGSHIVDPQTDAHLRHMTISDEGLAQAERSLHEHRPVVFAFAREVMIHEAAGEQFLPFVATWTEHHECVPDIFAHRDWGGVNRPVALIVIGSREQLFAVDEDLALGPNPLQTVLFEIQHPFFIGLWGMVIREAAVTKATAVRWLANHFGVSLEETITLGDWLNDVPMLLAARHSFAMAQAPQQVKRAAAHTLQASVETGGGLLEAARRCGLL